MVFTLLVNGSHKAYRKRQTCIAPYPSAIPQCFIIHYKVKVQRKILEKLYSGFYITTGDTESLQTQLRAGTVTCLCFPFVWNRVISTRGGFSSFLCSPSSSRNYLCAQFCKRLTLPFSFHLLSCTLTTHLSWKFPYLFLSQWELCYFTKRHCVSCRTGLTLQWSALEKRWAEEAAETPECVFESSLCAVVLEFATKPHSTQCISSKVCYLPKYFQVEIMSFYQFPTQFCISVIPASSMWVNYNFNDAGVLLPALSSGLCQKAIL